MKLKKNSSCILFIDNFIVKCSNKQKFSFCLTSRSEKLIFRMIHASMIFFNFHQQKKLTSLPFPKVSSFRMIIHFGVVAHHRNYTLATNKLLHLESIIDQFYNIPLSKFSFFHLSLMQSTSVFSLDEREKRQMSGRYSRPT